MRLLSAILVTLPTLACAYDTAKPFDAVRDILESRCLECHTAEEADGGLVLETHADLLKGGDSGDSIVPGNPGKSELIVRVRLPAGDSDRMPPKKHGKPLTTDEIAALEKWVESGATWPEGETLAPRAATALPRWDAEPDPLLASIEAYPSKVSLETAADFHRVVIIARMKDSSTHDITRQSKLTLADPSLATLNGVALNSMRFMLCAARIDTGGPRGAIRTQGAAMVFARILDVWVRDDDPGLARTMAKLDRELTNAGKTMGVIQDVHRLTAPFRAIGARLLCGGGPFRVRERMRDGDRRRYEAGYGDEAAAI